jgi:hypothetical protein
VRRGELSISKLLILMEQNPISGTSVRQNLELNSSSGCLSVLFCGCLSELQFPYMVKVNKAKTNNLVLPSFQYFFN